ncbi:MAG: ATP-binding protein [Smithella sp.]
MVLSVSDTGEGISAADLKRIFEPFYTRKMMGRSGTGLGLTVVWGTVEDHGGYINVQSEEGKGSTFTLYFPAARKEIISETERVKDAYALGAGGYMRKPYVLQKLGMAVRLEIDKKK